MMGHTPLGYKIENGVAVIDRKATAKVLNLYKNYLSGLSLIKSAKKAGIKTSHASAKHIMQNKHYLGDDFYPAIIDKETFDIVQNMADKNKNNYGKEIPYLFRGFFYCKECGHKMGIDRSRYTKANGEYVEKEYCICLLHFPNIICHQQFFEVVILLLC